MTAPKSLKKPLFEQILCAASNFLRKPAKNSSCRHFLKILTKDLRCFWRALSQNYYIFAFKRYLVYPLIAPPPLHPLHPLENKLWSLFATEISKEQIELILISFIYHQLIWRGGGGLAGRTILAAGGVRVSDYLEKFLEIHFQDNRKISRLQFTK